MSPTDDCSEMATHVSAYVDDELDEARRADVEAHLEGCEDCRAHVERLRALSHRLGERTGRESPPESVRAQIESLRFEDDTDEKTDDTALSGWRVSGRAWSVALGAVALLAGVAVGWGLGVAPLGGESSSDERAELESFASQLVADHEHSIPEQMPVEVASSDPERVRAFFQGRLPFEPVVPTLKEARLLGGRLCSIRDRRVELLFYDVGDETMSMYVSDRQTTPETCVRRGDYGICFVHRDRYEFAFVGALSTRALKRRAASIGAAIP
jgi:anti-sigma factor RsiW